MGEAKRRKKNDPQWGTDKGKFKRWWEESKRLLQPDFNPDFGHYHLVTFGLREMTLIMEGKFMFFPDREGRLLVCNSESFCSSIIITSKQYEEHFKGKEKDITAMSLKVKPSPQNRYKAKSGEMVVPFFIKAIHRIILTNE